MAGRYPWIGGVSIILTKENEKSVEHLEGASKNTQPSSALSFLLAPPARNSFSRWRRKVKKY
jgi:hypothetical protein